MIVCENISKEYQKGRALFHISCHFADTGFYLLNGESGSGKTTFLGILAGFISFDQGNIAWNGRKFKHFFQTDLMEYVTQDVFLIDYLNVYENLELTGASDEEIQNILLKIGMADKGERYPVSLSGGEQQRLVLARAILKQKRVILLDEPTSSLDRIKKEGFFEFLKNISKDILIICASHDAEAEKYADVVIKFSKKAEGMNQVIDMTAPIASDEKIAVQKEQYHEAKLQGIEKRRKLPLITPYLKKWKNSANRNQKSRKWVIVFFIFSLLLGSFADLYEHKTAVTHEKMYKTNSLNVKLAKPCNTRDYIISDESIVEIDLLYDDSLPDDTEYDKEQFMYQLPEYETNMCILPFEQKAFALADKIAYGTYFQHENDILITEEMAEALSPQDPQNLLGKTIRRNLYQLGDTEFTIAGILEHLNRTDIRYLESIGISCCNLLEEKDSAQIVFFTNGKMMDAYETETSFFNGDWKRRSYQLYFSSYEEAHKYLKEYEAEYDDIGGIISMQGIPVSFSRLWPFLSRILLGGAFLIMLFSILFFMQICRIEYVYNNRFVSVFESLGYPLKIIIHKIIWIQMTEMASLLGISVVSGLVIGTIVNLCNDYAKFASYIIFSWNLLLIGGYCILVLVCSWGCAYYCYAKNKTENWYERIIQDRDLL